MELYIEINEDDIEIIFDDGLWSAYCSILGIDSFGTTKKEAESNLHCAIALYLKSLAEKGILFERMKEKGIKIRIIPAIKKKSYTSKFRGGLTPVLVG